MATKYDVDQIRKKMQEKKGSRFKDVNEFRPPKAKEGEKLRYRFFVLPPLKKGDDCADGKASRSMDLFYVQNGSHWVNNKSHACPRVHDEEDCTMCQLGFDLISETEIKERRSEIAKQFLPRTQYAVNIYFPADKVNPDDVKGKIMWMNTSKQIYDKFEHCVMNDSEGDPEDPQAFGVFYDEEGAYLFQLSIELKNKKWNDYTDSKFLANAGRIPLSTKLEKLAKILAGRHDLFTKFQERDAAIMNDLVKQLQSGDGTSNNSGFDEDESNSKPATIEETPEDDVVDGLGEEVVTGPAVESPKAEPKKSKAKVKVEDDVDEAELQKLLNQIES